MIEHASILLTAGMVLALNALIVYLALEGFHRKSSAGKVKSLLYAAAATMLLAYNLALYPLLWHLNLFKEFYQTLTLIWFINIFTSLTLIAVSILIY